MAKFIFFYLLWLFGFFVLIDFEVFKNLLHLEEIHTQSTILFSVKLIELFGMSVDRVDGIDIYIGNNILRVLFGCNGLEAIILYFCAILSYPNSNTVIKLNWFFWGYLFLFTVNIFRITLLGFVIIHYESIFDIMHTYITQGIMIFIAFFIFVIYIKSLDLNKKESNV